MMGWLALSACNFIRPTALAVVTPATATVTAPVAAPASSTTATAPPSLTATQSVAAVIQPTATPTSAAIPPLTASPTPTSTSNPILTLPSGPIPTPTASAATPYSDVFITAATPTLSVTYLPTITRSYYPQAQMLGMAIGGFNNESGLDYALQLGTHWVRRWQPISWRDVEPNEGEYHWEALAGLESELPQARAAGIEPILSVQFTPEWAQQVVPYACGPIRADKFGAFAAFMEQLVMRYGSSSPHNVRNWMIGNELDVAPGEIQPDSVFGCWGDPNDAYFGGGSYAEMLKVVTPRMKAVDPQAQVILGGLLMQCDPYSSPLGARPSCVSESRWKSGFFLEGVMRAGGGDYFDMVDVHSYSVMSNLPSRMNSYYEWSGPLGGTGLPEKVTFVRQVMTNYGYGDKPVFTSEIALKCEEPTADCYDAAAAFIPRAYAEAYNLNLAGTTYFALISDFKYKGLLLPDFTPRPAYWAYKFMSSQIVGAQYEGSVMSYPGVSGAQFLQVSGQHVQIVWSTDGNDQIVTLPGNFAQALDKFGNPVPPNGNRVTVGWSPIYIVLN